MSDHLGSVTWSGPEDGPRVALVHGAMDRAAGLAKVARRLDDRAHVLRYDRRGYGRALHHPGPFTIEANVDDLIGLLDDFKELDRSATALADLGNTVIVVEHDEDAILTADYVVDIGPGAGEGKIRVSAAAGSRRW